MKAREILMEEGNVQYVDSPVTVRSIIEMGLMSRYAVTSTDNSLISWNCSKLEDIVRKPITFLWVSSVSRQLKLTTRRLC